jgi:TetR/AcrR family transcriptional regulator
MAEPETRDLILDAAESVFASRGHAGATIKEIAAAAGVNSALLYYYFADKRALYTAVLERTMSAVAAAGRAGMEAAPNPEEGVRSIVSVQARALARHRHIPQLMLRELIENDAVNLSPDLVRLLAGVIAALGDAIRRGQQSGDFNRNIDPPLAALSTISQVVYFVITSPLHDVLLRDGMRAGSESAAGGPHTEYAERLERFAVHAGDFAVAALRGADNRADAGGVP